MPAFRVGILGATGAVGQKFIRLLQDHPWFTITALGASERSAGQAFREAAVWREPSFLSDHVASMVVRTCVPEEFDDVDFVFSGLDSGVAGQVEPAFAAAGITVISNAKNFRMHPDVPLVIPEVNPSHLDWVKRQDWAGWGSEEGSLPDSAKGPTLDSAQKSATQKGFIVTNPNCVAIPLTMSLKPLYDAFGVKQVTVTSMQAISGAGYPGVPSMDIMGNLIPYIPDEESKIIEEPLKMLGVPAGSGNEFPIYPTAVRVPVLEGHTLAMVVELDRGGVTEEMVQAAMTEYLSPVADEDLPSAVDPAIIVHTDPFSPRPRQHADQASGMATHVGRIRCTETDKGTIVSYITMAHNTIRGAAGAAILNAELLVSKGYFSA